MQFTIAALDSVAIILYSKNENRETRMMHRNMNSIGATLLTMQWPKTVKKGRHDIKKSPQQTQAEKEGMG